MSNVTTHVLRTLPTYVDAVESGDMTFQVRYGDRAFNVGDVLVLREWLPDIEEYTGRELVRTVSYVFYGDDSWPAPLSLNGYVILGLKADVSRHDER